MGDLQRGWDNLALNRSEWDVLNAEDVEELAGLIKDYGPAAERTINDILHGEGAQEIKEQIARLLPASGRKWKGKKRAARRAMPRAFDQDDDMLTVTIAARRNYHYLYFPDDGSNTERHRGDQRFMRRGAEKATGRIVELCLGRLVGR